MLGNVRLVMAALAAVVSLLLVGCTAPAAPEPKTYKVDSVSVQGDTTYIQAKVTKTKIKVSLICKQAEEIACGSLHKGNIISALSDGGRLTKVKIVS